MYTKQTLTDISSAYEIKRSGLVYTRVQMSCAYDKETVEQWWVAVK